MCLYLQGADETTNTPVITLQSCACNEETALLDRTVTPMSEMSIAGKQNCYRSRRVRPYMQGGINYLIRQVNMSTLLPKALHQAG